MRALHGVIEMNKTALQAAKKAEAEQKAAEKVGHKRAAINARIRAANYRAIAARSKRG